MPATLCDAGPLMTLGKLNRLDLLVDLYRQVHIPRAVYDEVVTQGLARGAADAFVGRLVGAESVTHTIVYPYNGDGMRVASAADGVETQFAVDQLGLPQVLIEYASSGTTFYLYETTARLAQVEGSDTEWFLGDALGAISSPSKSETAKQVSPGSVEPFHEWLPGRSPVRCEVVVATR